MLFKLSYKNIKSGIKDYVVYFMTLALGVSMFYLFNSLDSQSAIMKMNASSFNLIETLMSVINILSYFISVIFGCLIIYASRFLIRRRKNEFGIYLTLGMSKKQVSFILVGENLLIGLFSLVVGLLVGIFGSYFVSGLVAGLFEADMTKFEFVLSKHAIIKTMICFGIIFLVDIVFHVFQIGRYKLIDMLYENRKSESIKIKRIWPSIIVFMLSIIVLGIAYHIALVDCFSDSFTSNIEIKLLVAIILGCVGTLMFFWSVAGFALRILIHKSNIYYRNLNSFSYRQLSYQINTNVVAMSIICILLFVTLCITATGFSLKQDLSNKARKIMPFDIEISNSTLREGQQNVDDLLNDEVNKNDKEYKDIIKKDSKKRQKKYAFQRLGIKEKINKLDSKYFDNVKEYAIVRPISWVDNRGPLEINTKSLSSDPNYKLAERNDNRYSFSLFKNIYKQSEYNKLAKITESRQVSVKNDEYVVLFYSGKENYQKAVLDEVELNKIPICGIEVTPKYKHIQYGRVTTENSLADSSGAIIVSDEMYAKLYKAIAKRNEDFINNAINEINSKKTDEEKQNYLERLGNSGKYYIVENNGSPSYEVLVGNYKANSTDVKRKIDRAFTDKFQDKLEMMTGFRIVNLRTTMLDESVSIGVIAVFVGFYIGGGCLIVSVALLALKELANNTDSIGRYDVLRRIGADEKMINASLFKQGFIFFMMPLVIALIHCIFGIEFSNKIFVASNSNLNMCTVLVVFAWIIVIYVTYFIVTYLNSKRIIKRK